MPSYIALVSSFQLYCNVQVYYTNCYGNGILCVCVQDITMMCQTLERLFEQKLPGMPKEVSGWCC